MLRCLRCGWLVGCWCGGLELDGCLPLVWHLDGERPWTIKLSCPGNPVVGGFTVMDRLAATFVVPPYAGA